MVRLWNVPAQWEECASTMRKPRVGEIGERFLDAGKVAEDNPMDMATWGYS